MSTFTEVLHHLPVIVKEGIALSYKDVPCQHFECCGLSCAINSQQTKALALGYPNTKSVYSSVTTLLSKQPINL